MKNLELKLMRWRTCPRLLCRQVVQRVQAIDEMSVADSFIMGVLRGWRLLQATELTAEEKRDILSTTHNSLEYDTIAQALQGLWDEQLLGQRPTSSHTP